MTSAVILTLLLFILLMDGLVIWGLKRRLPRMEARLDALEVEGEPPPILAQPGYAMPMPGVAAMERNLRLPSGSLRCYCEDDAIALAEEVGGEPKVPGVDDQGHCSDCGWPRRTK